MRQYINGSYVCVCVSVCVHISLYIYIWKQHIHIIKWVNCFPLGLPIFAQCALYYIHIIYIYIHTQPVFIQRIYAAYSNTFNVYYIYLFIYLFFFLLSHHHHHVHSFFLSFILFSRNTRFSWATLQMAYILTPFLVHFSSNSHFAPYPIQLFSLFFFHFRLFLLTFFCYYCCSCYCAYFYIIGIMSYACIYCYWHWSYVCACVWIWQSKEMFWFLFFFSFIGTAFLLAIML